MEALLDHGEGLLVPERMIVAPSVGVFRPVDARRGRARHCGPDCRHARRSRHLDAGREPVRGQARGHARAPRRAPPRGPAGRLAARRTECARLHRRLGHGLPEQRLTNADLEAPRRHHDQWIVERTGIRERRIAGAGETTASLAIEAGRGRDQAAPGSRPDAIDLLDRRDRDTRAADPPHRRVRRRRPRAALRLVRPQRRAARASSTSSSSAPRCSGRATSTTCSSSAPRRCRASSTRTTAARASSSATARPRVVLAPTHRRRPGPPRLGPRLRRLGHRPARDPRRRQPPARDPRTRRDGRSTSRWRARRCSGAPCAPSSTRRASRSTAPGVDRRRRRLVRPAPGQRSASSKPPASRLGIPPERTLVNIDRYGNTSAASIPLALAEAADDGRVHDGDLVLISGFGAGMTWGARRRALGPGRERASSGRPTSPRVAFVTGASRGHRPRDRRRARRARAIRSRSATAATTTAPRRPSAAVEAAGGKALAVAGRRRRRRRRRRRVRRDRGRARPGRGPREQRGHHPRRPARPDERRAVERRCSTPTSPAPSTRSAGPRPR